MIKQDEVIQEIKDNLRKYRMIAIDGASCSGKTTLAKKIASQFDFHCLELDNFFLPSSHWAFDMKPSYPFPYVRHDEFVKVVRSLFENGTANYFSMDWKTGALSKEKVRVDLKRPIIIEGISTFYSDILDCYDLRVFVESKTDNLLEKVCRRDGNAFLETWKNLLIPSMHIYLETGPQKYADIITEGNGVAF